MHDSRPLVSTDRIADVFEHLRLCMFALIVLISVVSAYGYIHVPTADRSEEKAVAAAPQLQRGGTTPSKTSVVSAPESNAPSPMPERKFEQTTTECLLVVEVEDVFDPKTARAVRDIVSTIEQLPHVARVFWLDRVPNLNMFGLSDPLIPPNGASAARFDAARARAMEHPLAKGQLISHDGRTLLIPVWLEWIHVHSNEAASGEILRMARTTAAKYPDVAMRIRLTGRVPLYLEAQHALSRNHLKFQIIGYTLVLVLAVVLFRGLPAVIVVAGAPALGIFWSHGLLKLFDQLDNPLTGAVLPVLVSMVGFTDGVHLIVHIRAARAAGATSVQAAKSAIQSVGLACLLTSLTTAIGFGSLMLASHEYVRGFGRACAIGVLLTFVAVITFIPLVSTTWLGRNIHKGHERDFVRNNLQKLAPLVDWVIIRQRGLSILAFALTAALLAWSYTHLRPDDRLRDSQPSSSEAYQALAHCDEVFGGVEAIEVRVYWARRHANDEARVLDAVQAARDVLDQESLINNKLSIQDFLRQLPGANSTIGRAAYLSLLPEAVKEGYYNDKRRYAAVTGRIQDLGIATFEPVFSRIEARLADLKTEYEGFNFILSGTPVNRGRQLYRIVVDLATSLGTATVIILLTMALVYRSWTIGFITIVPNMFPLVVTATYLVVVGQSLEIASVCSFTVCLGIAVDDSIHFLSRYQAERQTGKPPGPAVRSTFIGVGTALITTTLVLVAGFGTVLMSDLPGHRTFAAMACWTIGSALVGDLIFLPALLLYFGDRRSAEPE